MCRGVPTVFGLYNTNLSHLNWWRKRWRKVLQGRNGVNLHSILGNMFTVLLYFFVVIISWAPVDSCDTYTCSHYAGVIMSAMAFKITSITVLYSSGYSKCRPKQNIKAPRHWPLWGELTGDRWIPRTNGQLRGKCFHLMTSSRIYMQPYSSGLLQWHLSNRKIVPVSVN